MKKVKIVLEDEKSMIFDLYDDIAPISVKNFLDLVEAKYYDGLIFHRIIPDFMAQGGGYYLDENNLIEKEGCEPIKGEFISNGVNNQLKHVKGVISMARTNVKDSATSQFFICTADASHLDGEYAAFGMMEKDNDSLKTLDYLNGTRTINIGGGFCDFPYPIVQIKTIEIL